MLAEREEYSHYLKPAFPQLVRRAGRPAQTVLFDEQSTHHYKADHPDFLFPVLADTNSFLSQPSWASLAAWSTDCPLQRVLTPQHSSVRVLV